MDYAKALLSLQLRERMVAIFKAEHPELYGDEYIRAMKNADWKSYFEKAYREIQFVSSMLDEISTPSE